MSLPNNSRASELGDVLMSDTTGFVIRKRTGISLFFHLFQCACMVMLGTVLLVYYKSLMGCVLVIALGLSFGLIVQNLEKNKKMKDALEFMNALFSSAVGKGYQFCFIVKNTGEIAFYNRPFQAIFPDYIAQKTRTLDALLHLYHIPMADQEKLLKMVADKTEGLLPTTIGEAERPITLEIEPIERPTGFFLIRGK